MFLGVVPGCAYLLDQWGFSRNRTRLSAGYTRRVEFIRRAAGRPSWLGILSGTFNPLTVAHVGLGEAALSVVDEVLFALPRVLPHKPYTGASLDQRVEMLRTGLADHPAFSIAVVDGGLFVEIAEECRAAYGENVQLSFVCGRDAAERIIGWDYGRPGAVHEMLRRFDLLVAGRSGVYRPEAQFRSSVQGLVLPGNYDQVSATDVRERVACGERWEHLVPPAIVDTVRRIYRPA